MRRSQPRANLRTADGVYTGASSEMAPLGRPGTRHGALIALCQGVQMLYAIRTTEGHIKIGCSANMAGRIRQIPGDLLALKPGDFGDERAIHQGLVAHRAKGREYYHPTPEVLAVVNDLRSHFDLPPLAA